MTIYLDVILLENLCMNYIILFATALISKAKITQVRIILASLLGGIYAILSFTPILEIYTNIIFKILISIIMIYIAFNSKNVKVLLKQLLLFYLVSFAFGGCAFCLLYFIKPQDILLRNGYLTGTYPIKIALLGGIVGFVIVNIAFKLVKGRISKKDMFCDVDILFKQKSVKIKAMIDTGNLLKDPISNMPVIVVEKSKLEDIIPKGIINNLNTILGGGEETTLTEEEKEYMPKFRVIPFSSLGKQNGLLLGFIADEVIVRTESNEKKLNQIIVGIYDKYISKSGSYTGLIGLDIIERCEENEYFADAKR